MKYMSWLRLLRKMKHSYFILGRKGRDWRTLANLSCTSSPGISQRELTQREHDAVPVCLYEYVLRMHTLNHELN